MLVFMSRKGIAGLMRGTCTVGVDLSAAAGPMGRDTAIATDPALCADVYSYSCSRGLFLGASLEGTALEIDHAAHAFYYGAPTGQIPARVPAGAASLRHFLAELTPPAVSVPPGSPIPPSTTVPGSPVPGQVPPPLPVPPRLIEGMRRSLNQSDEQLQSLLTPEWRTYLALPHEFHHAGSVPTPEAQEQVLRRFTLINNSPEYQELAQRPEFKHTYELLGAYTKALAGNRVTLKLPPPPRN